MGITHSFVTAKTEGADTSVIRPSDWNADHVLGATVTGDAGEDGTEIRTAGVEYGAIQLIPGVLGGGEIDIQGGVATDPDHDGGNVGVFGGAAANQAGGKAEVFGGDGSSGGDARIRGGTAAGDDGFGGDVSITAGSGNGTNGTGGGVLITAGDGAGAGEGAALEVLGANEATNGRIQMFSDGSFGVTGQALMSDGADAAIWGTPSATGQTYAASNVTTDRAYNANSTTLDEVADVLGTLIADLRAVGIVL